MRKELDQNEPPVQSLNPQRNLTVTSTRFYILSSLHLPVSENVCFSKCEIDSRRSIFSNKPSSRVSVWSLEQKEVLLAPGSTQSTFSIIYTHTQYILAARCNTADQIYLLPFHFNKRRKNNFLYPENQNLMPHCLLEDPLKK